MEDNLKTVLIGTNENTDVYMEYEAYLKILRFAKAGSIDGSRGVFLGKRENGRIYIYIALEAMYFGDEGLEAPSFTQQSWERICEEIKEFYGEYEILGQYSTHPDIKPTEMDFAMQTSFFGEKSDLLFVFDPIENSSEIYRFSGKTNTALRGIRLFDKYGNEIDMRIAESILRPLNREFELRTKVFSKFSKKLAFQTRLHLCIFIVLLIGMVYLVFQNIEITSKYRELSKNINDLQWVTSQQESAIEELSRPTPTPEPTPTPRSQRTR